MSVHSAKVKRADEVVAGDWINGQGTAQEVAEVRETGLSGSAKIRITIAGGPTWVYRPDALVEVIKK